MKAGVCSRGSPMPKSMIGTPLRRSRARASASRTNGYVFEPGQDGGEPHAANASSTR